MKKGFLKIESAGFGYPKRTVLRNVSFEAGPGSISCVFGRNGSGKTTMLRSLAGLLSLQGGRVIIGEKDLSHTDSAGRARLIAIVQSGRPQIEHMTVADYVEYGRYPYTNWIGAFRTGDKDMIDECLAACGVDRKSVV